jgi:hypothetical protein
MMNRRKRRGKCSGMNRREMAKHEVEEIEVVNGSGRGRGCEDREVGGRECEGGRGGTIRAT